MALRPEHVQDVAGFEDLLDLLARRLDWPIDEADLEVLTFDTDPTEIGIDADTAGLQSVRQLRPLTTRQPWGISLLHFERGNLPVTVLRKVLRFFARKQRVRAEAAGQATWPVDHLLFVVDHGIGDDRQFSFAHFDGTQPQNAKLSLFGWTPGDPCRTLCEYNLPALEWPEDISDSGAWLDQWSAAFDVEKVTTRFFTKYAELFAWVKS